MKRPSGPLLVLTLLIGGSLVASLPKARAETAEPTRRDLRAARELLSRGRLADSLTAYDAILAAGIAALATEPGSWRARAVTEALYESALILLSADEALRDTAKAGRRLDELESVNLDPERSRVVEGLDSLLGEIDVWRSTVDGLTLDLEKERAALVQAIETGEAALEELATRERGLHDEITILRRESRETSVRLDSVDRELASRTAERDLLMEQLEVTQEDQAQMLGSVFRKNEELERQAAELAGIRSELELEREELVRREEEIEEREEAIRQVTEAILDQEPGEG